MAGKRDAMACADAGDGGQSCGDIARMGALFVDPVLDMRLRLFRRQAQIALGAARELFKIAILTLPRSVVTTASRRRNVSVTCKPPVPQPRAIGTSRLA